MLKIRQVSYQRVDENTREFVNEIAKVGWDSSDPIANGSGKITVICYDPKSECVDIIFKNGDYMSVFKIIAAFFEMQEEG